MRQRHPGVDMEPSPENQRFLLREIASGSKAAFSEFYDHFGPATFALCRQYFPDQNDAELAMARIWIHIWTHPAELRDLAVAPFAAVMSTALKQVAIFNADNGASQGHV
jgi:DNA-directed RNA polymerase specialized sigma24 family protein